MSPLWWQSLLRLPALNLPTHQTPAHCCCRQRHYQQQILTLPLHHEPSCCLVWGCQQQLNLLRLLHSAAGLAQQQRYQHPCGFVVAAWR